jgi:uncharacterized protein involved in exopolysaccharide biosynthesis
MNLTLFFSIVRSRYLLILFTLAVTVATTMVLTVLQPKVYIATTSLVLNFTGETPFEQVGIPAQLSSNYMATQLDIISSRNVALKAVDNMGLAENPYYREAFLEISGDSGSIHQWLAGMLLDSLSVEPSRESRVVNINMSSTDPQFAAQAADAYARAYISTTLDLSTEPARRNAVWFDEQIKVLRKRLEEAQARVTNYQQEKGIIAIDERLDTETNRLNELTKNLVAAQSATYDVKSRQLGENHPEYTRAVKAENAARYAVNQQKARILELKKQRDELAVLARELENEQETYEATLQSYYKTRLESQFNQTNIAILNPAVVPGAHSSPNMKLNLFAGVFLGLMLGVMLAIVLELLYRKIRTENDVSELLHTRVLASV